MNKFYTKYNHDKVSGFHFYKSSLTDQSQAYDSDINNIVNAVGICQQPVQQPIFGSEFNPNIYNDALNIVAEAKSGFENLPANVRREFNNDPMQLIQFLDNPNEDNCKKGVKLGIYNKDILKQFEKVSDVVKPILEPSQGENITPVASE